MRSNTKILLQDTTQPGFYSIECSCGKMYVGETKKKISTRLQEHERNIFHGRWENTGAGEHAKECQDGFRWEEARTLAVEDGCQARKICEPLYIRSKQREGQIIANRDS